eukprot:10972761-Alexandrium_andersonii.AAC.1
MPATISCPLEVCERTLEAMEKITKMYKWPDRTPDNDATETPPTDTAGPRGILADDPRVAEQRAAGPPKRVRVHK